MTKRRGRSDKERLDWLAVDGVRAGKHGFDHMGVYFISHRNVYGCRERLRRGINSMMDQEDAESRREKA